MYALADTTYDLNQVHHPILVIDGPHKGRTGESLGQCVSDPNRLVCLLITPEGDAFRKVLPYDHVASRFAPSTGCYEVLFRREGLL